jgi:hypothetical protein
MFSLNNRILFKAVTRVFKEAERAVFFVTVKFTAVLA